MTKKIIQEGEKVLRQVAKDIPLKDIGSAKIQKIIKEMTKVLIGAPNGVALAAPQIGESIRLFIIKLPHKAGEKENPTTIFINPKIINFSKKQQKVDEGCLSVDKIYGKIKRSEKITVEAYNEKGEKIMRGTSGLLAQIIQHEVDHLNGILFIDSATDLEKYEK